MPLKLKEFRNAGRYPPLPLSLQLPEDHLELREWLRVLPKRRYVARAEWRGRQVLAKLLVGSRAGRHVQRECDGVPPVSQALSLIHISEPTRPY